MSILTKKEIIKELKKGNIKIEPLTAGNIGPASVDLTLGTKFRTFKGGKKVYDVNENTDYKDITKLLKADSIIVTPQETVLGVTREK